VSRRHHGASRREQRGQLEIGGQVLEKKQPPLFGASTSKYLFEGGLAVGTLTQLGPEAEVGSKTGTRDDLDPTLKQRTQTLADANERDKAEVLPLPDPKPALEPPGALGGRATAMGRRHENEEKTARS